MVARAISEAFDRAGIDVRRKQAEIVGESSPSAWTRLVNGHASPTAAKVESWLQSAGGLGYAVEIRWSTWSGITVTVER